MITIKFDENLWRESTKQIRKKWTLSGKGAMINAIVKIREDAGILLERVDGLPRRTYNRLVKVEVDEAAARTKASYGRRNELLHVIGSKRPPNQKGVPLRLRTKTQVYGPGPLPRNLPPRTFLQKTKNSTHVFFRTNSKSQYLERQTRWPLQGFYRRREIIQHGALDKAENTFRNFLHKQIRLGQIR